MAKWGMAWPDNTSCSQTPNPTLLPWSRGTCLQEISMAVPGKVWPATDQCRGGGLETTIRLNSKIDRLWHHLIDWHPESRWVLGGLTVNCCMPSWMCRNTASCSNPCMFNSGISHLLCHGIPPSKSNSHFIPKVKQEEWKLNKVIDRKPLESRNVSTRHHCHLCPYCHQGTIEKGSIQKTKYLIISHT